MLKSSRIVINCWYRQKCILFGVLPTAHEYDQKYIKDIFDTTESYKELYPLVRSCMTSAALHAEHTRYRKPIWLMGCGMTAAISPHRLTFFIKLFHAANFSLSTVCVQVPFTFPATAVMLGASILFLSTTDPIGTGGHRDPNRGTLPGETGHQSVTVNPPFFLLPLLSFSLYFISLSPWLSPFPSFFLWGSLAAPRFSGNGLPQETVTWRQFCLVARAERDTRREGDPPVDIAVYLCTVSRLGAHYASIAYRFECRSVPIISLVVFPSLKPPSYLTVVSNIRSIPIIIISRGKS